MNMNDGVYTLLRSGNVLNLLDPSPFAWTDADLSARLARTYRWSSETRWSRPLSVAQHSLTVLHIREMQAVAPLSAIEQLRELLHDADEGLLHFDPPSPIKAHLGEGYKRISKGLRDAIGVRYDLPVWDRVNYQAHKRADRLAAASEAKHVVGWSDNAILTYLQIRDAPLRLDPLPAQPGLQPWEPWSDGLAAQLFLERLTTLQRQAIDIDADATIMVRPPEPAIEPPPNEPLLPPTYVLVEGGCESIEGQIVKGVRDADGTWDLDGVFTVQTDDGHLVRVMGWNCVTEIQG